MPVRQEDVDIALRYLESVDKLHLLAELSPETRESTISAFNDDWRAQVALEILSKALDQGVTN